LGLLHLWNLASSRFVFWCSGVISPRLVPSARSFRSIVPLLVLVLLLLLLLLLLLMLLLLLVS
jgi:hypothetical protein